jgi:hypothetical protein
MNHDWGVQSVTKGVSFKSGAIMQRVDYGDVLDIFQLGAWHAPLKPMVVPPLCLFSPNKDPILVLKCCSVFK